MRDRKSIGPQDWSPDVVDKIALKKEDNKYKKVDNDTIEHWNRYLDASSDSDQQSIVEILTK